MVGITERGDASNCYIFNPQENLFGSCEVFKWEEKLGKVDFAILITKCVTDDFIKAVMRHKDKVLIHATVTGYGGSPIEPNVFTKEKSLEQIKRLIDMGFPAKKIVLRVDPIMPSDKGTKKAVEVFKLFEGIGIARVRYSFMDIYPHVAERFKEAGIKLPYASFKAPDVMISNARTEIHKFDSLYEFESCAEGDFDRVGCISEKDYRLMDIPFVTESTSQQRKGCMCQNKQELLNECKRCSNKCLYCYWKD